MFGFKLSHDAVEEVVPLLVKVILVDTSTEIKFRMIILCSVS